MNQLQNLDAVLGIIVSAVTLLGFFGLIVRGRKNAHTAPAPQPASVAPQQRRRSRFPVVFLLFVTISGLAAFGWMASKRGDRDGFSRWGDGRSGATNHTWRQPWTRARR